MAVLAALMLAAGLVTGCGGDGDDPVTTRAAPAATATATTSPGTSPEEPATSPGGDGITEEGRRRLEAFYAESFDLTPAEARCVVNALIADQSAGLPLDVDGALDECRGA